MHGAAHEESAMSEVNELNEPLTDPEYDELEAFLGSSAVPQDCMDMEMLDGFLTAVVSGPELIQPSEWLPVVWSDSQRSVAPVYSSSEQAQRILTLIMRLQQGIRRTLQEAPTRFKPLMYHAEPNIKEDMPPEGSAWCEGYMTALMLREEDWEPLYLQDDTRDWILPIEALAYGDQDPEYADWVDSEEKRLAMIDELPIAAVLIYRFWHERTRADAPNRAERRAQRREVSRKGRQRLH